MERVILSAVETLERKISAEAEAEAEAVKYVVEMLTLSAVETVEKR